MTRVLVVGDAETDRYTVKRFLNAEEAIQIDFAEDGRQALDRMRCATPDLVLANLAILVAR